MGAKVYCGPRGEAHPWSKLKEFEVREIRGQSCAGWGRNRLGRWYGVSGSCVRSIVRKKTWKHLLEDWVDPIRRWICATPRFTRSLGVYAVSRRMAAATAASHFRIPERLVHVQNAELSE
jgi:hypothetical protein